MFYTTTDNLLLATTFCGLILDRYNTHTFVSSVEMTMMNVEYLGI